MRRKNEILMRNRSISFVGAIPSSFFWSAQTRLAKMRLEKMMVKTYAINRQQTNQHAAKKQHRERQRERERERDIFVFFSVCSINENQNDLHRATHSTQYNQYNVMKLLVFVFFFHRCLHFSFCWIFLMRVGRFNVEEAEDESIWSGHHRPQPCLATHRRSIDLLLLLLLLNMTLWNVRPKLNLVKQFTEATESNKFLHFHCEQTKTDRLLILIIYCYYYSKKRICKKIIFTSVERTYSNNAHYSFSGCVNVSRCIKLNPTICMYINQFHFFRLPFQTTK